MLKNNILNNFNTTSINTKKDFLIEKKIKVSNILKGNKSERKEKLKKFKQNLNEQYIEIATILNNFEEIINSNPDISFIEALEKITFTQNISPEIVKKIINGFKEYFKDRKESIKKYNKYKNNKKLLIQEVYNSDYTPKGEIELSIYKSCLLVIFKNKKDYEIIEDKKSSGSYRQYFNLITLKKDNKNTLKHEYQHYINSKFIKNRTPKKINYNELPSYKEIKKYYLKLKKIEKQIPLNHIKNEIIARENDNSSEFGTIINVLSNDSSYLNETNIFTKDTLDIDEQINYGIKLLTQINTLKKQYPLIYDYLILITKDTHLKNFIGEKNKLKENTIKTKLKIGNIILNKKFLYILYAIYILLLIISKN